MPWLCHPTAQSSSPAMSPSTQPLATVGGSASVAAHGLSPWHLQDGARYRRQGELWQANHIMTTHNIKSHHRHGSWIVFFFPFAHPQITAGLARNWSGVPCAQSEEGMPPCVCTCHRHGILMRTAWRARFRLAIPHALRGKTNQKVFSNPWIEARLCRGFGLACVPRTKVKRFRHTSVKEQLSALKTTHRLLALWVAQSCGQAPEGTLSQCHCQAFRRPKNTPPTPTPAKLFLGKDLVNQCHCPLGC